MHSNEGTLSSNHQVIRVHKTYVTKKRCNNYFTYNNCAPSPQLHQRKTKSKDRDFINDRQLSYERQ